MMDHDNFSSSVFDTVTVKCFSYWGFFFSANTLYLLKHTNFEQQMNKACNWIAPLYIATLP